MGGAPYIGPKLGGGPIIQVSVSQLDVKVNIHVIMIRIVAVTTIDFSLI